MKAGAESYQFQREQQLAANDKMVELWTNSGIEVITLNDEEKAQWVAAMGHQREEYEPLKDALGRKPLDLIQSLQG